MTIVINPDGTVSTVDVTYNRDGSIRGIKSDTSFNNSSSSYSVSRKKKRNKR